MERVNTAKCLEEDSNQAERWTERLRLKSFSFYVVDKRYVIVEVTRDGGGGKKGGKEFPSLDL